MLWGGVELAPRFPPLKPLSVQKLDSTARGAIAAPKRKYPEQQANSDGAGHCCAVWVVSLSLTISCAHAQREFSTMPQFPYATTLTGLTGTIQQLRSVFPPKVTADTLKKWNIAANNEGSVLQTLRFIGVVDDEGTKQPQAAKVFVLDDAAFGPEFGELVKSGYASLFELFGEAAWELEKSKLTGFFRTSDETSARVGEQQAATFTALASLAGHAPVTAGAGSGNGNGSPSRTRAPRGGDSRPKPAATRSAPASRIVTEVQPLPPASRVPPLSVRIELNLPVSDKQEVYDNIFRSIRENLLNANA